ncbi:hypothetical protein E0E54_13600 [Azotobacter chroococcum]|nr:IS3 family transposase [Azotobacter chroococcum]TBW34823.1 hypothetical protein E0E54_13600 [Azotobacter chroococcum]
MSKKQRRRTPHNAALVAQIQTVVSELSSHGYRRAWGLLHRQHERQGQLPVNVKWVFRVMRDHNPLLERRRKQPGVVRRHMRGGWPCRRAILAGAPMASSFAVRMAPGYW